jgi:hypothetical protein
MLGDGWVEGISILGGPQRSVLVMIPETAVESRRYLEGEGSIRHAVLQVRDDTISRREQLVRSMWHKCLPCDRQPKDELG